jgi:hypothetical protein
MTALALALVACCAMVCGTVLVQRRWNVRDAEVDALRLEVHRLRGERAGDAADIRRLDSVMAEDIDAVRAEVASLRADMAVHDVAALRRDLEGLRVTTDGLTAAFDRNEQQIADLRADMAVRSIA